MPALSCAAAVFAVALWALNIVIVRWGVAAFPPLLMTSLRFAVIAAALLPFVRLRRESLPVLIAMSVSFGSVHFGLMFVGLGLSEAGSGAIILQLGAPISILLAMVIFRERIGTTGWLGIALSLCGLLVLIGAEDAPGPDAIAALTLSAAGWAATNILARSAPALTPLEMTAGTSLFALPQTLVASLFWEDWKFELLVSGSAWSGWIAVGYSAFISSIVAYGIWYWLLQTNPVNKVVPFSLLNPVLAVLFGALFLDESVSAAKLAGGAIIIVSVLLPMLRR